MVKKVTNMTKYWTPVSLSFTVLMGIMTVPLSGRKVMRRKIQMRTIEMMQTGIVIKNQTSQFGAGFMFCSAMMFWGLAMGEAIPPIFDASAIPRIKALGNFESAGRFRSNG